MMKYQENSSSNIMNMPAILFAAFAVVILIAMYTNRLPNNMFGGLAVCLVFGYVLKFIIEHIPILHKTIGLAAVSFICAFLVYKNWIPESTVEIVSNTINGKTDILSFYVGALLCGSIIGMDRNMLIKAGTRYFVPILGGILFAYGISGLIGCLLGYDLKESLLYIAGPIMGGGNGAGAVPMSEIYAKASGESTDVIYSKIYPALTLGNWFAVFGAILLKNLGSRFHRLTGNGALMEGYTAEESKKNYDYTLKLGDLGIGMFITVAFFVFGQLVGAYVPAIHAYAFTIIAVALVKIIGIMPDKMEYCAVQWYQFMRSNFTVIIMAGVGIGMFNISTLFEVLSPRYLVMCLIVVMSATLGAGLFGMLVKFFFVESGC